MPKCNYQPQHSGNKNTTALSMRGLAASAASCLLSMRHGKVNGAEGCLHLVQKHEVCCGFRPPPSVMHVSVTCYSLDPLSASLVSVLTGNSHNLHACLELVELFGDRFYVGRSVREAANFNPAALPSMMPVIAPIGPPVTASPASPPRWPPTAAHA